MSLSALRDQVLLRPDHWGWDLYPPSTWGNLTFFM